jgi:hypothetical protein
MRCMACTAQLLIVLDEYRGEPITIRHRFYRLVSRGVLEKDEKAYRNLSK